MFVNRTLIILKPDAVERGLIGDILSRFERRGLKVVAADLRVVSEDTAKAHYAEHSDRPFFGELVAFITRSPVFVCAIEGPEDTWKMVRVMMGTTNPADAAPGTIRGDFGTDLAENLIHGSDGPEAATREISIFFPALV
jgi:nucleoside-diphosphate kinase